MVLLGYKLKGTLVMQDTVSTRLRIDSDKPVANTSALNGANIASIGFNMDYIAKTAPILYVDLMHKYEVCKKLEYKDAPEDEYIIANQAMLDLEDRISAGEI